MSKPVLNLCDSVYMVLLRGSASENFPLAQSVHECIVPEVPGSRLAWGKICPGYIYKMKYGCKSMCRQVPVYV